MMYSQGWNFLIVYSVYPNRSIITIFYNYPFLISTKTRQGLIATFPPNNYAVWR